MFKTITTIQEKPTIYYCGQFKCWTVCWQAPPTIALTGANTRYKVEFEKFDRWMTAAVDFCHKLNARTRLPKPEHNPV